MSSPPPPKRTKALPSSLPTARIGLSSPILRRQRVEIQYKHKRLPNIKREKITRHLSRNGIRHALMLARSARASITAKKVSYVVKIEEVEHYLGLLRNRHLILEQREAAAEETIGDVRDILDQNGIPELSYSDSENDDDNSEEATTMTYPPSSDTIFSELHHMEETDDSDFSDGEDAELEIVQEVTLFKGDTELSIHSPPTRSPHAVAMVAGPSEGPSCRGDAELSIHQPLTYSPRVVAMVVEPLERPSRTGDTEIPVHHLLTDSPRAVGMVAEPSEGRSCGSTWQSVSKPGSTRS
ncbi:hypothetical protein FIBSPDRAFT_895725 [Athelia psychrophila]|uniref:Uncharacterized protein n=1 Tax=Athelia psychrophila TaxID=1759441 RepID=A0A166EAK7_9AGAM|nr:hypothetical protein FIBSPDRAFT_895725 [Fibularhizoctonia sp. CBS 109695]